MASCIKCPVHLLEDRMVVYGRELRDRRTDPGHPEVA